jgi:hypothetical protein
MTVSDLLNVGADTIFYKQIYNTNTSKLLK